MRLPVAIQVVAVSLAFNPVRVAVPTDALTRYFRPQGVYLDVLQVPKDVGTTLGQRSDTMDECRLRVEPTRPRASGLRHRTSIDCCPAMIRLGRPPEPDPNA